MNKMMKHSKAWHARHDPSGCAYGACRRDAIAGKDYCPDHQAQKHYQDAITGNNPKTMAVLIAAINHPSRQ